MQPPTVIPIPPKTESQRCVRIGLGIGMFVSLSIFGLLLTLGVFSLLDPCDYRNSCSILIDCKRYALFTFSCSGDNKITQQLICNLKNKNLKYKIIFK
jgi:hypothetical protein